MRLLNRIKTALVKGAPFGAVLPELLQESADGVLGQGNAGVVTASKGSVVLLLKPAVADARVNNLEHGDSHDPHGVVRTEDCQQIRLDIAGHRVHKCTGSVREPLRTVGRQTRFINNRNECQIDDVADGAPIAGSGILMRFADAFPALANGITIRTVGAGINDYRVARTSNLTNFDWDTHNHPLFNIVLFHIKRTIKSIKFQQLM